MPLKKLCSYWELMLRCVNLASIAFLLVSCSEKNPQELFNQKSDQAPVLTHDKVDSVYDTSEKVAYLDIPESYRKYSDPNNDHLSKLKGKKYLVVQGDEIYTYVVGKFPYNRFLLLKE